MRKSASDDHSAVAVAVTVVTVRVDTDDVMLVRARRAVLLVNSLLNCEFLLVPNREPSLPAAIMEMGRRSICHQNSCTDVEILAVVVPVVAELLPPLKRTEFI